MEPSISAKELIAACEAKDKPTIARLVSSIPKAHWDVIPGRADCLLDPVKIQVWHETGGSGINTYETILVQLIIDERYTSIFRFTAKDLKLPNYIPVSERRIGT